MLLLALFAQAIAVPTTSLTDKSLHLNVEKSELIIPPLSAEPPVGFVLVGRADVAVDRYQGFTQSLQHELSQNVSAIIVIRPDLDEIDVTLSELEEKYNVTDIFFIAHSMTDGGIICQDYLKQFPSKARGLILLESFLQRKHRPDVPECLSKISVQPVRSLHYPLGFLADHTHDCNGTNVVQYPVPVLTIAGELDGVVRVTRVAEAFYTQRVLSNRTFDYFAVIRGLNHASVFNVTTASQAPPLVASRDLRAEKSVSSLWADIGQTIRAFVVSQLFHETADISRIHEEAADFFDPILEAFVVQEGNWFFTGYDDEHGSSLWAANAQRRLSEPLPPNFVWDNNPTNEFRLTCDEDKIPPYYRQKHRAAVERNGNVLSTSTIAQLRFIEVSVVETAAGLNGWANIKEEKLNILNTLLDDGSDYVSAIEIATKMASRQMVFNVSGVDSPASLDDGNKCQKINQLSYQWALNHSASSSVNRFSTVGVPMSLQPDKTPTIPAGPFWIWSYLEYSQNANQLNVTSYGTFFSTDSNPYGAGTHYCKLLSPARVVEWIYVDGLRAHHAL